MGTRGDLVSAVYGFFFIFRNITFLLMSIIYVCMGETNCATGKRIRGHFFTFRSCTVCKCKVKMAFPLSENWWVALRILFTPWKEIELFSVVILCNAKWYLVHCFVLGRENSDPTVALHSLCGVLLGASGLALHSQTSNAPGPHPASAGNGASHCRGFEGTWRTESFPVSVETGLGPWNKN